MTSRLVVLVFLLAACGEESFPVFEIGTAPADGTPTFVALTDGQDVTLAPGAQGGFHVFLNVRADASLLAPDQSLVLERRARREDTEQLVSQAAQLSRFVPAGELFATESTMVMFLCPVPVGISIGDQMLVVNVRAFQEISAPVPIAEADIRLRPRCPEGEQAEFCGRICYAH